MVSAAGKDQLSGEEEFNKGFILPSLIIQLRKILEQYPDDIQILKVSYHIELIDSSRVKHVVWAVHAMQSQLKN